MIVLPLPQQVDVENAIVAITQMATKTAAEDLVLDFGSVHFVKPFATLLLAESVRTFIGERARRGLITRARGADGTSDALAYLRHFGFFKYVGLPIGKEPSEAPGSSSYLPITVLRRGELTKFDGIQGAIEREAVRLTRIVIQSTLAYNEEPLLQYCFREIIRNVFEHAGAEECSLMAQRWSNGVCEIAIADRGRGILASLQETHSVRTDADALALAIRPGITRVKGDGPNIGFGLYVLSSLGARYGLFSAASNTKLLQVSGAGQTLSDLTFRGTAIQLRIRIPEGQYPFDVLERIVEDGKAVAASPEG